MFALIGGSGFDDSLSFTDRREETVETPYGPCSSPLIFGRLEGAPCVFLYRHGVRHQFAPHHVPARANLWALKNAGAEGVFAVATVGGAAPDLTPGRIALPDQLIDYTWGREVTYHDDFSEGMMHADMTKPFDERLRRRLADAAKALGEDIRIGGTYACMQGPRLETAAEVKRCVRDGADMLGMTLYPECALARELGLPYAGLCLSVNWAAGLGDSSEGISLEKMAALQKAGIGRAVRIAAAAMKGMKP